MNAVALVIVGLVGVGWVAGQIILRRDPDSWRYDPPSGLTEFDHHSIRWTDEVNTSTKTNSSVE